MAQKPVVFLTRDQWQLLFDPTDEDSEKHWNSVFFEMPDGSIRADISNVRYAVKLWHSDYYVNQDVEIIVQDVYDVDFVVGATQSSILDTPIRGLPLSEIRALAQENANTERRSIIVIFINGDYEDYEVQPDELQD